ncbi:MAG TPA: class I SAM-dependent methyltransferase [Candidatus Bathyarchaeia archaeon]|nr:class I SAM-dependent methyltransferase [Candidatus Bathyarchaeia archaeon]
MKTEKALRNYYNQRAQEYESIYHRDDPIRQQEQNAISKVMKEVLRDRSILEVACGTGFWTQIVSQTARHIVAIDSSTEMLQIAKSKTIQPNKVTFLEADAYALSNVPGSFEGGLANFWFSHIPKTRINEFLLGFHKKIVKHGAVFMADNTYVPGIGGELVTQPGSEDTFKVRKLVNGSEHVILKNYYTKNQLRDIFTTFTANLNIHLGSCFWWISYEVA